MTMALEQQQILSSITIRVTYTKDSLFRAFEFRFWNGTEDKEKATIHSGEGFLDTGKYVLYGFRQDPTTPDDNWHAEVRIRNKDGQVSGWLQANDTAEVTTKEVNISGAARAAIGLDASGDLVGQVLSTVALNKGGTGYTGWAAEDDQEFVYFHNSTQSLRPSGYGASSFATAGHTHSGVYAPVSHSHAASDVTSGTFADARIAISSVTQHEAQLTLAASQIASGTLGLDRIPSLPTSKVTSGAFADARISQSSVTQHQSALSIAPSQLSSAVPVSKGGTGYTSFNPSEIIVSHTDGSSLRASGTALADLATASHNHDGTYEPTFSKNTAFNKNFAGSGSASTVARSDHNHSGVYSTTDHTHPTSDIVSGTFADERIASASNWNTAYGWGDHSAEGYSVKANAEAITGQKRFDASVILAGSSTTDRGNHDAAEVQDVRGTTSSYRMTIQDGTGRVNMLWNASAGDGVYLVSSEQAMRVLWSSGKWTFYNAGTGTGGETISWTTILELASGTFDYKGNEIWHAGNDGPASGLDADTLDGSHAAAFSLASHDHSGVYAPVSHAHALDSSDITGTLPLSKGGTGYGAAPSVGEFMYAYSSSQIRSSGYSPSSFATAGHDHDSDYAAIGTHSATISSSGWYRIAHNGPCSDGGTGGNRAGARFVVRDTTSGRHSYTVFYASYCYSSGTASLTLLNRSTYGGNGCIHKIRIVAGQTYEGGAVEIYVSPNGTADVQFWMMDNLQNNGWTIDDWTAGSVWAGADTTVLDFDDNDMVMGGSYGATNDEWWIDVNGTFRGNLNADDLASGSIPNARVPISAVTQHEAQLALAASQTTSGTFSADRIPSLPTSKITSGTFVDARISASSVTQHQASLSIAPSQLSDVVPTSKGGTGYGGTPTNGDIVYVHTDGTLRSSGTQLDSVPSLSAAETVSGSWNFTNALVEFAQKLGHYGDADTYVEFLTNQIKLVAGGNTGLDISTNVYLAAAAGGHHYLRAGGYWYFQDVDASNTTRVSINSANGDIGTQGNIDADGDINGKNVTADNDCCMALDAYDDVELLRNYVLSQAANRDELTGGERIKPSPDLFTAGVLRRVKGGQPRTDLLQFSYLIAGAVYQGHDLREGEIKKLQRENKKLRDRIVSIEDRLDLLEKAA